MIMIMVKNKDGQFARISSGGHTTSDKVVWEDDINSGNTFSMYTANRIAKQYNSTIVHVKQTRIED